jgi:hypothetical protein
VPLGSCETITIYFLVFDWSSRNHHVFRPVHYPRSDEFERIPGILRPTYG